MKHGGTGFARSVRAHDRGQGLVVDFDQFGCVFRLLRRFGNDDRDMIADIAHLALREARVRWFFHRLIVDVGDQPAAGQAVDARLGKVFAGESCDHAGGHCGLGGADTENFRVCVGGSDEMRVGLVRQRHVVGVVAGSGEKAVVLTPFHRLPDERGGTHDQVLIAFAPAAMAFTML